MKLVENWGAILAGSWSVRLMVVASILSALSVFFDLVSADILGLDPIIFAALAAGVSALGVIARIVQQAAISGVIKRFTGDEGGAVSRRAVAGIAAASIAASVAFVAPWEGLRTQAYQDVIGQWTVCYGETNAVAPGDTYTPAECAAMLDTRLQQYAGRLSKCLTAKMPEGAAVAFLSWSYNVGTGAACRSAAVRKANAGDLFGACDELLRWNRAGGRVVPGLVNRRASEHELCVRSLVAVGLTRPALK